MGTRAAQAVITTPHPETTRLTLIHTIPRPGNNPAYRRHVYFWMREEVRMRPGARNCQLPAREAWKRSKQYVEALS
jgi:hypothetical protein